MKVAMNYNQSEMQLLSPNSVREICRSGAFSGQTAGLAPGYVQANLMILPRGFAFDFLLFCQRNPKPCPLVEVLEPGIFSPGCAPGADLRSDVPGYRIFHNGEVTDEVTDITTYWRDDLVSFVIGCSFSFEAALIDAGIRLRHVDQGKNVSMYKTNKACLPAGRMSGNMVVSMRPIKSSDVARAVEISARFPQVHGAPVHVGNPEVIGIKNIAEPDFGDSVDVLSNEVPVFWACGVTPQYIAQMSRLPFCITHAPGKMFITDVPTK
jgi:uncharacterized protein YcsI (UPF0317 family)